MTAKMATQLTQWQPLGEPFETAIQDVGHKRARRCLVMPFASKKEMRAMQWKLVEGLAWY